MACVDTNSLTLLLLSSFFLRSFEIWTWLTPLLTSPWLTSRGEWIFSRPIWYGSAYSYLSPFLHVNYKQLNGLASRYNPKVNRLLFAWMLAFLQEKEKLEMEKSEGESIRKNSTQKIKAVSNTVNMEFIVYIMINLNFYGDTKGLQ